MTTDDHPRHRIRRDLGAWRLTEPTGRDARVFASWPEAIATAASHDGGATATTYALMGWRLTADGWGLAWRCWRCWPAGEAPNRGNGMTTHPKQHDAWHYDTDAAADIAARERRLLELRNVAPSPRLPLLTLPALPMTDELVADAVVPGMASLLARHGHVLPDLPSLGRKGRHVDVEA